MKRSARDTDEGGRGPLGQQIQVRLVSADLAGGAVSFERVS